MGHLSSLLRLRGFCFLYLLLLSPVGCFADVFYNLTGQFDGTAPTTTLTAPNTSFDLILDVTQPVVPYNFDAAQSDIGVAATYTLGVNPVNVFTPTLVLWVSGGLTGIIYDGSGNALRLDFGGPTLFTGPTSAPDLILPESFSATPGTWASYDSGQASTGSGSVVDGYVTTTPEPGSGIFLLAAVVVIGFGVQRRKRRTA